MDDIQKKDQTVLPWGFWSTLGIAFIIIIFCNFILQFIILAFHVAWHMFQMHNFSLNLKIIRTHLSSLSANSFIISESIIIPDIVSIMAVVFFIRLKNKEQIKSYLGFNKVDLKKFVFWQAAMIFVYYFTNFVAEKTSVSEPEFMKYIRDIMASDSKINLVLMFSALVIVAPLFEEIMFRGFMYSGLVSSRVGITGAFIIPAVLWSVIHFQYEWIWVLIIFIMGMLFGIARYKTNSIYTVIAMHAVNNLLSFLEVVHS